VWCLLYALIKTNDERVNSTPSQSLPFYPYDARKMSLVRLSCHLGWYPGTVETAIQDK
jgi:hypothetical protein